MPVGLVTLISVSQPPITSRPTKKWPRCAQPRAERAHDRPVALVELGRHRAWRRRAGCRARRRAPARAAPRTAARRRTAGCACRRARTSGRYFCAIVQRRPRLVACSRIAPVFGSPLAHVEHAEAARGVQRLDHHLAALLGQERCAAALASRVTMVGGQSSGYSSTASFSFCSRRPRGSLMISVVPARPLEQQRREVVVEVERRVLAHQHRVAARRAAPRPAARAGSDRRRRGGRSPARRARPRRRARATGGAARRTRSRGRAPAPPASSRRWCRPRSAGAPADP